MEHNAWLIVRMGLLQPIKLVLAVILCVRNVQLQMLISVCNARPHIFYTAIFALNLVQMAIRQTQLEFSAKRFCLPLLVETIQVLPIKRLILKERSSFISHSLFAKLFSVEFH